jgi:hypothetical protein
MGFDSPVFDLVNNCVAQAEGTRHGETFCLDFLL